MSAPRNACESHDHDGECTQECADLVNLMSASDGGDPIIYGDYLGGTSTIDWSRTHEPEPTTWEEARLDPARRAVVLVTVCPHEAYHDATDCDVCDYLGQ